DGSFYGGRGRSRRGGFRNLSAGGAPARTQRRRSVGDGQPLRPQEREGQRVDRAGGRGGPLPAALLSGLQPDRGGILEDQEPAAQSRGTPPRGTDRGGRGGDLGGQRGGCAGILRALRLPWCGSMLLRAG